MAARKLSSFLIHKTIPCALRPTSSLLSSLPCATWSRLHAQLRHKVPTEKRFSSSVPKPQKETPGRRQGRDGGPGRGHSAGCGAETRRRAGRVKVTFVLRNGSRQCVEARVGDNLLDIILEHEVDIDGFGACEGTLACSTCHLIFRQEDYDKLPSKPTDEELDMLDLAFGLEDTSRLGCQVIVTKDLDGMEVTVPQGVADARSAPL